MSKILWISGDHPRHIFVLNNLIANFDVGGVILEKREKNSNTILPIPPTDCLQRDTDNFNLHFKNRLLCEKKYFGNEVIKKNNLPIINVLSEELNAKKTIRFIQEVNPEITLLFGCSVLKKETIDKLPFHSINLHGGLSPRYKGVATLFWPFYFLEPNNAGFTFHYLDSNVDSGRIIHQCLPKLAVEDKIHDVACKAVLKANFDILKILDKLNNKKKIKSQIQTSQGKTFYSSDFRPEHLRVIYDHYEDEIVKMYLKKKINPFNQPIFDQFK